jgi:hypothetical protein
LLLYKMKIRNIHSLQIFRDYSNHIFYWMKMMSISLSLLALFWSFTSLRKKTTFYTGSIHDHFDNMLNYVKISAIVICIINFVSIKNWFDLWSFWQRYNHNKILHNHIIIIYIYYINLYYLYIILIIIFFSKKTVFILEKISCLNFLLNRFLL